MKTTIISDTIIAETEEAYLLENGDHEVWIPKSQVFDREFQSLDAKDHEIVNLEISEWLAIEKGLV